MDKDNYIWQVANIRKMYSLGQESKLSKFA